ncbi:MAG: tetratricopeptide repeat protein [Candidatus Riflebacteria bacterium]|nr:tetratricopeptide repeat protein [Candidatus Riflebacteria bacterium]
MVAPISIEDRDRANQHLDSSISLSMCGKLDQAVVEIKKAIAIDPEFAQAHNKLGDYLMKMGLVKKAVDAYTRSLELAPNNQNSNFDLGCSLAHLGRYEEALEYLQKALQLKPSHTEIYGHIGRILMMRGELEEAITNLNRAIEANPEDIMSSFTLACAYNMLGETEKATRLFNKVIGRYGDLVAVKKRFAEGHYYIGRSYFIIGNLTEALKHLEKAVEYDTEDVDYHYSFGMLYSDADAFCSLAEVQHALGSHSEARENVQKAIALEPHNQRFSKVKSQLGI